MPLQQFERSLRDDIGPVWLILGEARPLVERALARLEEVIEPSLGPKVFNRLVLRASEANAEEAFRTARTLPMMGARRLVVLRDVHEASDAVLEALEAYLRSPVPEAVVVIEGRRLPKNEKGRPAWGQRIKRALPASASSWAFEPSSVSAVDFARAHAEQVGKRLGPHEARRLIDTIGEDLERLEREVDKLATYVGDRPSIEAGDIEAATALLAEAVVWDLTAAVGAGDRARALASVHRLQVAGEDPRKLLSMIAWQVRELLRVSSRLRAGKTDREILAEVRVKPDMIKRLRQRAAQPPDPAVWMGALADANRAMNAHRAGAERILEDLVVRLVAT